MPDIAQHIGYFLSGMGTLGLLAHAVQTFPTPSNKYAQWALGCAQWAVGQRLAAKNTLNGLDSDISVRPPQPK